MKILVKYLFWLTIFLIAYTYLGYYLVLRVLTMFTRKGETSYDQSFVPEVSIIVAAYNEGDVIGRRIENLLQMDYPREKMEIIVASDGSTDKTAEKANEYTKHGVVVFDFKKNRGKAETHNDSIILAKNDIVVLTDADSLFENNFVRKVVLPFSMPEVGCVVGNLLYMSSETNISETETYYYNNLEYKIKDMEDRLGILANGTGACMAIRKSLFVSMTSADDTDTYTVLDLALKGYKIIFAKDAIAYDIPPKSAKSEFKCRVRATSKTIVSITRSIGLRLVKNPVLFWNVTSHRLLRYLTPYFLLLTLVTNCLIAGTGTVYKLSLAGQALFYLLALMGWAGESMGKRLPLVSKIFSFCVVMLGMFVGVTKGLMGKYPYSHKTDDGLA